MKTEDGMERGSTLGDRPVVKVWDQVRAYQVLTLLVVEWEEHLGVTWVWEEVLMSAYESDRQAKGRARHLGFRRSG